MLEAANPRHRTLDAHAKASVLHRAVLAQIDIPVERFFRQLMFLNALQQQFDRPIMVDRFPMAIKAFYMAPDPDRSEVALGVDVLAPEGYGEIIGGGQRLHDLDLLLKRIEEHHLPKEAFDWYIDLRKYGTVPHGGFGMGIERCVAWICGLEHVRETIAFPRMLYRLRP